MKLQTVAACAIVACSCAMARAPVQHAFLVQNSGWMEPFYTDAGSQLKPLVAAVAAAVVQPHDEASTLAFNQSAGANASPRLLSQSQGAGQVAAGLAALQVARKGRGAALADTDFREAILGTINGPFQQASGVLWIFTNNRNSPNNDSRTAERNREFYQLLHSDPSITKTLAFPLRMPVKGKWFEAQGLMVYALAYGAPAAQALDRILAEGRLAKVLTRPPARLKPVDQDALRVVPRSISNAPHMQISLADDQRTLVLDVDPAYLAPRVTLQASLQNRFYPYAIASARVHGRLIAPQASTVLQLEPAQVQSLDPAASRPVQVQLTLPVEQVPSAWSMPALSAMGKQMLIPLQVELGLSDQHLEVSQAFRDEMHALFPGDPLSDVFMPPALVRSSRVQVPLLLRVQYPLAPVLAVVGGVLLLVGGLAALGLLGGRTRRCAVVVDGQPRQVMLKVFSRLPLRNLHGEEAGVLQRQLGAPRVASVNDGHSLTLGKS
ncbi:hypothetical protein [Comamonas endophytica]|uniref:Oxygen tolerance protein BatD n=1 Tax=Comamonas endophytica TaxID=2949090 RepID=A0ABY6G967_9BURK|nr:MULTISPECIES: hypothetical protein [unclassified Acidovorax]MCD2511876.1 hypothetical protein [Acidovorax sp. D4N7]UYG51596.1 hypothetical protein M9799_16335 [Acidovorax sp. 5MLIR]